MTGRTFNPSKCPRNGRELFWYFESRGLGRFNVMKERGRYVLVTGRKICATYARNIDNWSFEGWERVCIDLENGFGFNS